MSDIDIARFAELREFAKWMKDNPDEYDDFKKQIRVLLTDMVEILKTVN